MIPSQRHLQGCLVVTLCLFLFTVTPLFAATATLSWSPPTTNVDGSPLTDLGGYRVYYGTASRSYSTNINVSNVTTYAVNNLTEGATYYFAVTAYDTAGNESAYSNEVSKTFSTAPPPPPPPAQHTLTVSRNGSGSGTVTGTGISCGTDCSETFTQGTLVSLSASPSADSTFSGWSGACSGTGTCSVTMDAAKTVTASFALKTYTITASTGGHGTISPSGSVQVNHGASRTFTITPDPYYAISSVAVDGQAAGKVASYTFSNVTAAHDIYASFSPVDTDLDGLADLTEMGPFFNDPMYDGNGDGIPDRQQANVASLLTYDAAGYLSLVAPEGQLLAGIVSTQVPQGVPAGVKFPYQFVEFLVQNMPAGSGTTLALILPEGSTVNNYLKYGPTPDDPTPHWYEFMYDGQTGAEIQGNIVYLHFVDGLRGDDDIAANGQILDQGGPAKIPDIAVTPPSADFGSVATGAHSQAHTFTVTNTGYNNLVIGAVTINGAQGGDFVMQSDTCSSATLSPSAICTVTVAFAPLTEGVKSATLDIPSNDYDTPVQTIALGGAAATSQFTLTIQKSGNGTVSSVPAGISCGTSCAGAFAAGSTVTLTATAGSDSQFMGWAGACSGTGQCMVTVNANKTVSALFAVKSPNITVTPASYNFGSIRVGRTSSKTFSVRNTGTANLVISKVEITGTNAAMFASKFSKVITLTSGGYFSLRTSFIPTSQGLKNAVMRIYSDDPDAPIIDVSLSGTGR